MTPVGGRRFRILVHVVNRPHRPTLKQRTARSERNWSRIQTKSPLARPKTRDLQGHKSRRGPKSHVVPWSSIPRGPRLFFRLSTSSEW